MMFDSLQNMLEQKLKERGLTLNKSDLIDWVQDLLPEGADDTLGRTLRTLTSQFWGSMFRITKLEGFIAEFEVWATPKKVRQTVHPAVVIGAATEMVLTLWERNLLLNVAEITCVGVEANWKTMPNGVFVRYQLSEEEIQRVLSESRASGPVRVDCPVKVCDQDSCILGDINVICHVWASNRELPPPPSE